MRVTTGKNVNMLISTHYQTLANVSYLCWLIKLLS